MLRDLGGTMYDLFDHTREAINKYELSTVKQNYALMKEMLETCIKESNNPNESKYVWYMEKYIDNIEELLRERDLERIIKE
jgi:hypothetical protein